MDRCYRGLVLFTFLVIPWLAFPQVNNSLVLTPVPQSPNPVTFQQIDSITYAFYLQGNWKEVLKKTRLGLQEGIDYYYLRMRAGIAALELNNAEKAVKHFRKALSFNSADKATRDYLQYSLNRSGNFGEARWVKSPTGFHMTHISMEGGYMFTPASEEVISTVPEALVSHHYFVRDYAYASFGLNVELGSRFGAVFSTNTMQYNAVQQFHLQGINPLDYDLPFRQNAGYISFYHYLGKGFTAQISSQVLTAVYELKEYQMSETGGEYVTQVYGYNDLAFHAGITSHLPYANLTIGGDWNRFHGTPYMQVATQLTWYPLGSTQLYLQGDLSLYRPVIDSVQNMKRVVQLLLGYGLSKNIWLEGFATLGDLQNWSEKEAYVVYNNLDPIKNRMGVNLIMYGIWKNIDLSIRYIKTERTTSWQLYDQDPVSTEFEYTGESTQTYPHHSIIGGLSWRF